ncbi:MAG: PilZ domain-containing protein [Leptospira sp.]|nr:PilZ domain-containing protein [Leptospira sp.]
MTDFTERRKHIRIQPSMAMEVKIDPQGSGHTKNISVGGITFSSDTPYELGTILDLSIRMASLTGSMELKGKVLRCDPIDSRHYTITVNYVDTDTDTELEIEELIKNYS